MDLRLGVAASQWLHIQHSEKVVCGGDLWLRLTPRLQQGNGQRGPTAALGGGRDDDDDDDLLD